MKLNAIQAHLRASACRDADRVGPFLLTIDPDDDTPARNYAIPDDGARPTPDDVRALLDRFADLGRMPRLEYVAPAPALDAALAAAGFTVDRRLPLMAVEPAELVAPPRPPSVDVILATSDADLRVAARVQETAYGGTDVDEPDVARLRRVVDAGGAVALAVHSGTGVGSGLYTPPADGLTEIAAVGVLPEYRRRGIAAAVSHRLAEHALAHGTVPYLQAESTVYGRLGFRTVGEITFAYRPPVPEAIRTNRLVLYPLSPGAAGALLADGTPPDGLTAGDGWPHADTHDALGPAAAGDSLCWLVTLDATVIGDCGTAGPVHETGEVEIGYGLAAPYRGHGYGTELVRALSRWLLRQPGVRHVVAQVEPDNAASRATLRRTGFAADGPDRYRRNRAPASRSVDSGPPRLIADERETLLAFVAYLRERVIAKCAGLSDVDARRSAVGSGTSLLWLVKHVTAVEIFWLWHAFAGRDRDVIPDPELTVDDTVESTVAAYRAIVAESERIVRGCPELDRLAVHEPFGPPRRSLRWILVHLVEELARHAGHADILRELADGTVGR